MSDSASKLRRILVIDDELTQLQLIREMVLHFRRERFVVDFCHTFEQGLQHLLTGRHAVCLLDYQLEAQNGIDLIREARAAHCRVPIILLTGASSDDIENAAISAGAIDYLVKSEINPQLLERVVRYTLRVHETMDALRRMAIRDDLTGLFNRRELERMLKEEWQRATRFNREFSFILFDLDHFKNVNDTYGHQVGDAVLRHVASLLAGQSRSVDRVARYGGEEFAVIQIESNREGARDAADRLRILLADMPCILAERGLVVNVTLSAGVAAYPADAANVEELIGAADKALYVAKALGRNRVVAAGDAGRQSPEASNVPT